MRVKEREASQRETEMRELRMQMEASESVSGLASGAGNGVQDEGGATEIDKTARTTIEELEATVRVLLSEKHRLLERLQQLEEGKQRSLATEARLENEVRACGAREQVLRREAHAAQSLTSAQRELEDVDRSQLAAILHALSELEAENLEMRSSFERLQGQVSVLESTKRELEEELRLSWAEKEELQEELQTVHALVEKLQKQFHKEITILNRQQDNVLLASPSS